MRDLRIGYGREGAYPDGLRERGIDAGKCDESTADLNGVRVHVRLQMPRRFDSATDAGYLAARDRFVDFSRKNHANLTSNLSKRALATISKTRGFV